MKAKLCLAAGGLLAAVLLGVLPGCEGGGSPDTGNIDSYFADHPYVSDPRDPTLPHDMSVTPASANANFAGQSIVFTVKGGRPTYHWDVVNGNGSVASAVSDGSQGIYTVNTVGNNSVVVYDEQGHSAIAGINSGSSNAVTISPTSVSLSANGGVATFSVSGGVTPYVWSLLNANGVLNTASGTSVAYTRSQAGDNAVIVTDSIGARASVAITQP